MTFIYALNGDNKNIGLIIISNFNQEGGKVTGNIGNLVVESRQNTSTTTGSSKGVNLGISANGIPSSVTINASRTNGNRAFVDNQSTFVVGEGSSLHVGTVENTGAVIGKEGNSTFKIDTYAGKDIQNYDTMTATVRHETQHSNDKSTRLNEGKMKILKKILLQKHLKKME